MEAPNNIIKLTIFLFEILRCLTWLSKLKIGLTQFWSPNLFNCLAKIDLAILSSCIWVGFLGSVILLLMLSIV